MWKAVDSEEKEGGTQGAAGAERTYAAPELLLALIRLLTDPVKPCAGKGESRAVHSA